MRSHTCKFQTHAAAALGILVFASLAHAKKPTETPGGGGGGGEELQVIELHPAGSSDSFAAAINDAGIVVGAVDGFAGTWDALADAPTFAAMPGGEGGALAINDVGEIVGWGANGPRYWTSASADPVDLPMPLGFVRGTANGVSTDGIIVGEIYDEDFEGWVAVWRVNDGSVTAWDVLSVGGAHDVASLAPGVHRLVGRSADEVYGHVATAWDLLVGPNGTFTVLESSVLVANSTGEAFAITPDGDVAGILKYANTAFVIRDGALDVLPSGGKNEYGVGYDLNDSSVVGKTGPSWLSANMIATRWNTRSRREDLTKNYFPDGWSNTAAEGINTFGDVVGSGTGGAWLIRNQ